MPGEAKITLHDKYVLVNVEGDPLSPEEIKFTLTKAIEQAIKFHLNIIIAREMPVKQRASTIDFYFYAEILSESKFRNKLALVFPKEMHHDNLDFFETASKNRGINLGLFSAMEEALKWIDGDID